MGVDVMSGIEALGLALSMFILIVACAVLLYVALVIVPLTAAWLTASVISLARRRHRYGSARKDRRRTWLH